MSILDCLPDDLRLRVLHFLPAQDRAKLALQSKAFQLLSLDSWSAFSMTWDETLWEWDTKYPGNRGYPKPKLLNMLDWLAKLAQHSQYTLHCLELHCTNDKEPALTLPRFGNLRKLSMYDTCSISKSMLSVKPPSGPVLSCQELEKLTALQHLQELSVRFWPPESAGYLLTLREFAALTTLCSLSVTACEPGSYYRDRSKEWVLSVCEEFAGLPKLIDLGIFGIHHVRQDTGLKRLLTTLHSLSLSSRELLTGVVEVPQLTRLRYWPNGYSGRPLFPLHTSGKLQDLHLSFSELSVPLDSHSVTSLSVGYWRSCAPRPHFPHLTALRKIYIGSIGQPLDFREWATFHRLQVLKVKDFNTRGGIPDNVVFKALVELELDVRSRDYGHHCNPDLWMQNFPALRRFKGRHFFLRGPVVSLTLQSLDHVCRHRTCWDVPQDWLGYLPHLQTLRIQTCLFRCKDSFIAAIASMPELRELCLESINLVHVEETWGGDSRTTEEISSCDVDEQKAGQAGFIDTVLTGLAQCKCLRVLKLVCLHDKVTMTRELPRLDHLGIACKELNILSVSILEELPSIDLHFAEARESTMDQLTACPDLRVLDRVTQRSRWNTETWRYINVGRTAAFDIKDVFAFQSGPSQFESADADLPKNSPFECLQISYSYDRF